MKNAKIIPNSNTPFLANAMLQWEELLGEENVDSPDRAQENYGNNTINEYRTILGALRPNNQDQVSTIIEIASRFSVPIYPISTGRNWGYGSATPASNNCVILDLSALKRIRHWDPNLGIVSVEPGVTQADLYEFLKANGAKYITPTSGAGPNCSLLGNALERGYGITPKMDHFGAVTRVKAILGTGEVIDSPLSALGGELIGRTHKWGIGPFVQGIFSQSNLAVVTEVTLSLAPKSESVEMFQFSVGKNHDPEEVIKAIHKIKNSLGDFCTGINIMNAHRVLAMTTEYPKQSLSRQGLIEDDWIKQQCKKMGLDEWTVIGAICAPKGLSGPLRKEIKRILRGKTSRVLFADQNKLKLAQKLIKILPNSNFKSGWLRKFTALDKALKILDGVPQDIALQLAYWLEPEKSPRGELNPAKDGVGLIWYAPLVPILPREFSDFTRMVRKTCDYHGIEPLITLTTISNNLFDSTIPILYKKDDKNEESKAWNCYFDLVKKGKQNGWLPYRLNIKHLLLDPEIPESQKDFLKRLKEACDPKNIIAPGRYIPKPKK